MIGSILHFRLNGLLAVWIVVNLYGLYRSYVNLEGAREDNEIRRRLGRNGPLKIVARAFVRAERLRVFIFVMNCGTGIASLLISPGRLVGLVIGGTLVASAFTLVIQSEVSGRARRKAIKYDTRGTR